jgi:hypothetical protein
MDIRAMQEAAAQVQMNTRLQDLEGTALGGLIDKAVAVAFQWRMHQPIHSAHELNEKIKEVESEAKIWDRFMKDAQVPVQQLSVSAVRAMLDAARAVIRSGSGAVKDDEMRNLQQHVRRIWGQVYTPVDRPVALVCVLQAADRVVDTWVAGREIPDRDIRCMERAVEDLEREGRKDRAGTPAPEPKQTGPTAIRGVEVELRVTVRLEWSSIGDMPAIRAAIFEACRGDVVVVDVQPLA